MADFNLILPLTLQQEGGYSKDPHDPGGETYRGISRRYHPDWAGWAMIDRLKLMRHFPESLETEVSLPSLVTQFYRDQFWTPLQGDSIKDAAVAASLFDFAVNAGTGTAILLSSVVDNIPKTKTANTDWVKAINEVSVTEFLPAYCLAKIIRYQRIVQQRPDSRRYFYGWVQRALHFV